MKKVEFYFAVPEGTQQTDVFRRVTSVLPFNLGMTLQHNALGRYIAEDGSTVDEESWTLILVAHRIDSSEIASELAIEFDQESVMVVEHEVNATLKYGRKAA